MTVPLVAGITAEPELPHPPPMAGVVVGAVISLLLWAVIGAVIYLVV